jgi:site-specific DNA-methyltransferase (adenine-specific)
MTLLQFMNNNMQLKEYENIKLYHGDCMDLMRETPDKYYDLCIVDPPYGIGFSTFNRTNKDSNGNRYKANKYKNGNWDEQIPQLEYFTELTRISKNQIVWGGNYFPCLWELGCKGFIFWYKQNPVANFSDGELAWTSFDRPAMCFDFRYYGGLQGNTSAESKIHPTQKPTDLYDWIIKNYVNQGAKILDTHLGSGSIVISVDKANKINNMNLRFTGIEIDVDYFNDMIKRFENYKSQLTLNLQ